MQNIPLTKDVLHSTIDYGKLIEIQSGVICNNGKKNNNTKAKTLVKTTRISRGGKR